MAFLSEMLEPLFVFLPAEDFIRFVYPDSAWFNNPKPSTNRLFYQDGQSLSNQHQQDRKRCSSRQVNDQNAVGPFWRISHHIAKVQIHRNEDPTFINSGLQYIRVRRPKQVFVTHRQAVVPMLDEQSLYPVAEVLVEFESHGLDSTEIGMKRSRDISAP